MNKKQITITIIAILFFIGIFMGSQEYDPRAGFGGSNHTNVGFLLGAWVTLGVVWLALLAMLKSKPKI